MANRNGRLPCLSAGVNLQAQGLKVRSFGLTVDEPDNERQDAMDACPATVEE
jgi:hypothetical protein